MDTVYVRQSIRRDNWRPVYGDENILRRLSMGFGGVEAIERLSIPADTTDYAVWNNGTDGQPFAIPDPNWGGRSYTPAILMVAHSDRDIRLTLNGNPVTGFVNMVLKAGIYYPFTPRLRTTNLVNTNPLLVSGDPNLFMSDYYPISGVTARNNVASGTDPAHVSLWIFN